MKWIYEAFDGEGDFMNSLNPVCVDVGNIEKIILATPNPDWKPTDFTVIADGVRCGSSIKLEAGRVGGFVCFSQYKYVNSRRRFTTRIDMNGKYPKNGDEVDMRGVCGWGSQPTICTDPRIMYVFNVLVDALLGTLPFSKYYVRNPNKKGPIVIPVKVEHPFAPITEHQEKAIREAVASTIPDGDASVAYLKRFGYPCGKQKMSMEESSIRASMVMAPLSEEKVEFLLSLIK